MGMELFCITLAAAGILSGLFCRKKVQRLEQRMGELTEEIGHFLNYPSKAMDENLKEGEIYNLENQISRLENQILHEKEFQSQREEQVNRFVENMAHQMKTAVTALQIRLDLAQMQSVTDEEKTALGKSQMCMERLTGEIDRILKSSQLAAGKIQMSFEPIYLEQEIRAVVGQLRALTDKRKVEVFVSGGEDTLYYGDSFWLLQAVENIVKNAAEHTKPGGKVWIFVEDHGSTVSLKIEDEGKGIPAEELPLLFQRFTRGSVTKSGYGVGLSMAKDIVEAHHGSLTAGNREGGGAEFSISLPVLDGAKAYERGE